MPHKKTLIFIFVFISLNAFSQKIDQARLKCYYQYEFQKDTIQNKTNNDILVLMIGSEISKCLSHYSNQIDSLNSLPNGDKIMGKMIDIAMKNGDFIKGNYPHKRMKTYIYKNFPKGKVTVTDGLSLQDYIYEDELNPQVWEIKDSIRTILGYTCQMATCNFRGRHWTAWFAPEIPVSDGPWKFSGLPGLIFEVKDAGSQYVFTIYGIQKVENEPIYFSETHKAANLARWFNL